MKNRGINHTFNREKHSESASEIQDWLKANKIKQLDSSDNSGLIFSMYPPAFRKKAVAASKHKARKKFKDQT